MARDVISGVLADKVAKGHLREQDSLWIAERILHSNPCDLYGLSQSDSRKVQEKEVNVAER